MNLPGISSVLSGELGCKIVESAPKILDSVARNHSQIGRDIGDRPHKGLCDVSFRVELEDDLIGIGLEKSNPRGVEIADVFIGLFNLGSAPPTSSTPECYQRTLCEDWRHEKGSGGSPHPVWQRILSVTRPEKLPLLILAKPVNVEDPRHEFFVEARLKMHSCRRDEESDEMMQSAAIR